MSTKLTRDISRTSITRPSSIKLAPLPAINYPFHHHHHHHLHQVRNKCLGICFSRFVRVLVWLMSINRSQKVEQERRTNDVEMVILWLNRERERDNCIRTKTKKKRSEISLVIIICFPFGSNVKRKRYFP